MKNKFSTAYGLLVITNDYRVVLIERTVPYCIQNYLVQTFEKQEAIKLPFDNFDREDYHRFLNDQIFEDQWDIPHGQIASKKREKRKKGLGTAYREFCEETGFVLDTKRCKKYVRSFVRIDFVACDNFEYTQFYYILTGVNVLENTKSSRSIVDKLVFRGHLLTFQEAYNKLLQQQTLKKDNKHLLIEKAFNMAVQFNPLPPTIHSYDPSTEENLVDYYQIARDRQREEPFLPSPSTYLQYAIQLFQIKENVVVFGNLGRYPHLLNYYLDICIPHHCNVRVVENNLGFSIPSCYRDDGSSKCDILIFIEPTFGDVIRRWERAKKVVYLTSHLNLYIPSSFKVMAYQFGELKSLPPQIDEQNTADAIMIPRLGQLYVPYDAKIVKVDLTKCRTAREAYLCLLQAREQLSLLAELKGYFVCIKNHQLLAIRSNLKSAQMKNHAVIPGNVKDLQSMIDWYKA